MLFFTDLDNTMIYSHRHVTDQPLVWVEELHGRKQSYMTQNTYSFFEHQNRYRVIPLTTRTKEQYLRLSDSLNRLGWRDVLICNGAIRIYDGKEDLNWTRESIKVSEADRPFFEELLNYVRTEYSEESVVEIEPFLFYIKTDAAEETCAKLLEKAEASHLMILRDARKVYCLPRSLNKGRAVERYKKMTGESDTVSAGDSLFDLPMLKSTDICFYPTGLAEYFENQENQIECAGLFSDVICDNMRKRISKR